MKKILISILMALILTQANSIKSAAVNPKLIIVQLQKLEAQITANITDLQKQLKEAIANGDKPTTDLIQAAINTAQQILKMVQGQIAKIVIGKK